MLVWFGSKQEFIFVIIKVQNMCQSFFFLFVCVLYHKINDQNWLLIAAATNQPSLTNRFWKAMRYVCLCSELYAKLLPFKINFRATINLVEIVNVYNEPKWSAKKRTRVIKLLQSTTLGYYVFAVLVLGGAVAVHQNPFSSRKQNCIAKPQHQLRVPYSIHNEMCFAIKVYIISIIRACTEEN